MVLLFFDLKTFLEHILRYLQNKTMLNRSKGKHVHEISTAFNPDLYGNTSVYRGVLIFHNTVKLKLFE